jgi:hypothetical protein
MRIGRLIIVILVAISIVSVLNGCNPSGIEITGSENLTTKAYDLQNFTRVELNHTFNAEITQSDDFSISVTVDDNIIDFLVVQKSGSTLKIGLRSGRNYLNITGRVIITMPYFRGIVLKDSSHASVSGFTSTESLDILLSNASHFSLNGVITTESLAIRASDAGSIDFEEIKSNEFEIHASGSSKISGIFEATSGDIEISGGSIVNLEGKATDIRLVVSGGGKGLLENLFTQNGDITLSGSGIATVNVSGRLEINASGSSSLTYFGNPTLGNIDISDAASVVRK